MGYIYIVWNPVLKDMVKIGYTMNLKKRLEEMNSSTVVPAAFRLYAAYEVENYAADKVLHKLIDTLNPSLRIKEVRDGKIRVREFYTIDKNDVLLVLSAIAFISNTDDKLYKFNSDGTIVKSKSFMQFDKLVDETSDLLFDAYIPSVKDFMVKKKSDDNKIILESSKKQEDEKTKKQREYKILNKNLNKIFEKKSNNIKKFEPYAFSSEWELVGVRMNEHYDDEMLCENCHNVNRYLLILKNVINGNEVLLCRNCIDIKPNGHFVGYFGLNFTWDIIVLDELYKIRKKVIMQKDLSFCDLSVVFLDVIVKAGCISKEIALQYVKIIKEYPMFVMKTLTTEEKVNLQDLCTLQIVPFLNSNFFDEWRFDKKEFIRSNFDLSWIESKA